MELQVAEMSPWTAELEEIRRRGLFRVMPPVKGIPGRMLFVHERHVLNFSSNNYLGLAGHPRVIQGAIDFAARYGAGSTASRLVAGNGEAHRELESFVARWKGTEAALLFGSGYQANVGVLSALLHSDDLIISDRLNHASIIDGCRLSRAQVKVYRHFDLDQAEELLRLTGFKRKLLVTESIFSMDGDRAPLRELDELCRRYGALLMVDEAHGAGVFGPAGQGWASGQGVVPEIQMGTLGKAVGSAGAYVAGSRALIELLINRARSLIYTTAPTPAMIGSALEGLRIIASEEGAERRRRLRENTVAFRQLLADVGLASPSPSHIVPVRIGESLATMEVSAHCLAHGVFAHGIRFPTVPEGTARLRFTLMSDHTADDLRVAVSAVTEAIRSVAASR